MTYGACKPHLFTGLVAVALSVAVTACFGTAMTYTLDGRVIDNAGTPLAEVSIIILEGPGDFPDLAALTGTDGRFSLHGLAAGAYALRLTGPGARVAERRVVVSEYSGEVELRL